MLLGLSNREWFVVHFFFIGIAVLQDTVLSDPPRVIIMWKAWKLNLNLHQMP